MEKRSNQAEARVTELTKRLEKTHEVIRELIDKLVENHELNTTNLCNHPGKVCGCDGECADCTTEALEEYRNQMLEQYLPEGGD